VNTDPVCFPCNNVTRMNKMKNYSDNRELSKILTWININGFILDSIREIVISLAHYVQGSSQNALSLADLQPPSHPHRFCRRIF